MKLAFALAFVVSFTAVLEVAQARPPRLEFMSDIRRTADDLDRDARDLADTASHYGRWARGSNEERRDTLRGLQDLYDLSNRARDLTSDVDRYYSTPANTESTYLRLELAYTQVLRSFGDASVFDRPNVKADVLRVTKSVAKLRFYYDIADGGWMGQKVSQYAIDLDSAANSLVRDSDRILSRHGLNSGELSLLSGMRQFSDRVYEFRRAAERDFSRCESSRDEFFRMKAAYDALEASVTASNLPDEVVGGALRTFDIFNTLSIYYLMLQTNQVVAPILPAPAIQPYAPAPAPAVAPIILQVPYADPRPAPVVVSPIVVIGARWNYDTALSLANHIRYKTEQLANGISGYTLFGGAGKRAAHRAASDLNRDAQNLYRELSRGCRSREQTLRNMEALVRQCDYTEDRIDNGSLPASYGRDIDEIIDDVERLIDIYEYKRLVIRVHRRHR